MVLESEFPPDIRVENEIESLVKAGYEVSLICYTMQNKPLEEEFLNSKIYRIPISRMKYKFSALALKLSLYFKFWENHIYKLMKKNNFDALHIHDLSLVSVGYKLAKQFNISITLDLHENRPEIMKMYKHVTSFPGNFLISVDKWQDYQRKYSTLVDKLILVTQEAKKYYIETYNINSEKIHVVPNYINLNKVINIDNNKNISKRYENKFLVLYLGDRGIRRGTLTIIEAANKLKNLKGFHFLIIGKSIEQKILRNKIFKYNLSNVELSGWMEYSKAISFIKSAKVGLCPFLRNIHHDTTYSNKMFQYMAFGKPIIVSDCTAQANLVRKENCGLVFKAGDFKELSEKIVELSDNKYKEQLCVNAKKAVLDKFNWKNSEKNLLALYSEL